jgi:hypothetical protein
VFRDDFLAWIAKPELSIFGGYCRITALFLYPISIRIANILLGFSSK